LPVTFILIKRINYFNRHITTDNKFKKIVLLLMIAISLQLLLVLAIIVIFVIGLLFQEYILK
jgi:hypothetical protein